MDGNEVFLDISEAKKLTNSLFVKIQNVVSGLLKGLGQLERQIRQFQESVSGLQGSIWLKQCFNA